MQYLWEMVTEIKIAFEKFTIFEMNSGETYDVFIIDWKCSIVWPTFYYTTLYSVFDLFFRGSSYH